MNRAFQTLAKPMQTTPVQTGVLQRQCACKGADEEQVRRPSLSPDSVPLFESRLGHTFSNVRVDTLRDEARASGPFESRIADPNIAAEDQPFAQALGEADPIHTPMLEEYRRRAGLPPGGVDEFGRPVGPSDAELKYGGTLVMPGAAQSTARFVAGPTHNVWNLAARIAVGNSTVGFTPPLLNGSQIMGPADAVAAIHRPSLSNRTTGTGAECWINTILDNEASFDMTLPTTGPWSTVTPRVSVAGLLGHTTCTAAGDTTFTVQGDPSSAVALANIQRHEQHHASDHERIFNAVAVPWHTAMTRARDPRRTFNGADVPACEAALYAAMGGTPDQIATNLWNGWIGANNAFHGTPAGALGSITGRTANADCSVSSINFSHP